MEHRHGAPPWSMQPCHGALPHQSAACSSHSWTQYSGIPCGHAQPCQLQVPAHFVVAHVQNSLGPLQPTAPHLQHWTTPMQFQGCSGRHHTAEPEKKRELNEAYCLVDKEGKLKPFSSVSQPSGGSYEGMLSKIFESGAPQILRAVQQQTHVERMTLQRSKDVIAKFLGERVSDGAGKSMEKKGTAEQEAEVDTVYSGSFKNFAESISKLSEVIVGATCTKVKQVLVEICSDSRLVAMKLYQIEIQSCLVKRQGYLVGMADQRQMLTWNVRTIYDGSWGAPTRRSSRTLWRRQQPPRSWTACRPFTGLNIPSRIPASRWPMAPYLAGILLDQPPRGQC